MPDDTITLTGTATDDGLPSGSSLTYKWVVVSGPPSPSGGPSAIIASPTAASTSVRLAGGAGQYVFSFTANDSALESAASTLTVTLASNTNLYPAAVDGTTNGWQTSSPAAENLDVTQLDAARDYSLQAGITSPGGTPRKEAGYIIRHGKLVYSWGDEKQLFDMKSTTKSMGGLALFLALDEGKLALADKAAGKLPNIGVSDPTVTPTNGTTAANFADITVLQLATHTAGFSKADVPIDTVVRTLDSVPGTTWAYSDQGLNWLADVLTQTYNQDLDQLMFSRIFTPLGIRGNEASSLDLVWRTNQGRISTLNGVNRRELASGISTNVNAMARVGLLMLRKGAWGNAQLLSNAAVATAHTPPTEVATATIKDPTNYPDATTNYGILWWTNTNGALNKNPAFGPGVVPTDAYWAWGLHETFIIVIPSQDMVIVRAADTAGWHTDTPDTWNADYDVLAPFLRPIAAAVTGP
jgi:CubicO group peptidase (beta-lactamase class C family)